MHAAEQPAESLEYRLQIGFELELGVGAVDDLDVEPERAGAVLGERLAAGEPVLRIDVVDGDSCNGRILAQQRRRDFGRFLAIAADSLASGLPVTLILMIGIFSPSGWRTMSPS
jgi:hypothetical protein